jgi:hypothetical protein
VRLNFKVIHSDGSATDATASVADQVAFEREFDKSIAEIASNVRITDMAWLAWHGLKRSGKVTSDFDAWLDNVDGIEMADAEIVPLETSPPTG